MGTRAPALANNCGQRTATESGLADSRFVQQREPQFPGPGEVLLRCGHCLACIPDPESDASLRCSECGRRNALPTGIWLTCDRCGFEQRVRTRAIGTGPCCASCGAEFESGEIVLKALFRHRRRHHVPSYAPVPDVQTAPTSLLTLGIVTVAGMLLLRIIGLL
jgi:hypothetical protein